MLRGENARLRRALDGDRLDVEALRLRIAAFAKERDWDQFHTPRNILLALVGEVGELAECFQWKGEVARGLPAFSEPERTHVRHLSRRRGRLDRGNQAEVREGAMNSPAV